jgi:hypothetical protein
MQPFVQAWEVCVVFDCCAEGLDLFDGGFECVLEGLDLVGGSADGYDGEKRVTQEDGGGAYPNIVSLNIIECRGTPSFLPAKVA